VDETALTTARGTVIIRLSGDLWQVAITHKTRPPAQHPGCNLGNENKNTKSFRLAGRSVSIDRPRSRYLRRVFGSSVDVWRLGRICVGRLFPDATGLTSINLRDKLP
jgi:hypothetical protein